MVKVKSVKANKKDGVKEIESGEIKQEGIDFGKIEKKWQEKWEKDGAFEVKDDFKKKKYYVLEMYPYPSGSGLHIGHAFNYTIGDIFARYKRMSGFNVLYPMGYDSFGLPAENAAIKAKSHPKIFTDSAIENFVRQQKSLGLSYDWSRKLQSHDPEYYKWNQFFFLEFMKKGLVYRKKSPVNWCPECNSVLANEQVHQGKCWRHGNTDVEIKHLEQWFLKTTKYADELLEKIGELDWPERIKSMQENWIGKSEGSEVIFEINGEKWPIFTTRADTLFGVTFVVVSAQHPKLMELVTKEQKKNVDVFLKKIKSTSEKDAIDLEKEGVFTGSYAINPLTKEKVPVWTGNFVVADYGSGMVMAVPAHDQRDFDFAQKYKIPVKVVVRPNKDTRVFYVLRSLVNGWKDKIKDYKWSMSGTDGVEILIPDNEFDKFIPFGQSLLKDGPYYFSTKGKSRFIIFKDKYFDIFLHGNNVLARAHGKKLLIPDNELDWSQAFTDYGTLFNSKGFDGLESDEAREHITVSLQEKKLGKKVVQYKLRDWLLSRQRYWGTPIPVVYCDKCGIQPVSEKELPVLLPEKVKFGEGNPLVTSKEFVEAKCSNCKGKARRETDTMDTFMDSSWYYLRFTDAKNKKEPFSKKNAEYWMPVDFYTGGAEHACMHLIYARFFTKVLRDLGYLKFDEPFKRLFNQGMVHGEDGFVMSKSRGNVIDPLDVSKKYGVDTLRMFLVSMAGPDKDSMWSNTGIESMNKFVAKMYSQLSQIKFGKSSPKTEHKVNKAIKDISEEIEYLRYNASIIKIRALIDSLEDEISKVDLEKIVKIIAPFCPHIAEELWEKIGGKGLVSLAEWPEVDEGKIDEKLEEAEKNVDKTVSDIINVLRIVKEKQGKEGEKVYLYVLPNEFDNFNSELLSKRVGKEVVVFKVNDKNKHDPEGKAGKAKPGKPGIYVE